MHHTDALSGLQFLITLTRTNTRDDSNFPSNRELRKAGKRALLNAFGVQVARRVARAETDFGPPNRTNTGEITWNVPQILLRAVRDGWS